MAKDIERIEHNLESSLQDILKAKQRLIDFRPIMEFVSNNFPNGKWENYWYGDFQFKLPYKFDLIKQIKEFDFPGYKLYHESNCIWESEWRPSAGYFIYFIRVNERGIDVYEDQIKFRFETDIEGSTCVLNQIGTKEVPVWETTCNQGKSEFTMEKSDD